MAPEIERVVDAHIHLWDPANTEWYPYLTGLRDVGMGDLTGWARYFDQKTYFSEAANWNVEKFVHVSAASDFVAETMAKDAEARATGHPDAIIGGATLADAARAVEQLDRQMASSRFRGVRAMGGVMEHPVPSADALQALAERDLIFEILAHPEQLQEAASDLAAWGGELTVVIEHAGWPHADTDEEFASWKKGMSALADVGPHVHCKLSGLATPFRTMDPKVLERWIEYCLDTFGVDRCFIASNFPPDSRAGTFDELYTAFATLTAGLGPEDREKLFAANAERLYRC